ncbi:MAG TPA: helix-turn-helix domain-containing protein [Anaerolineales bacterium]|nr:helix-turn-helix domain-containing protein [Anaerolineales bacterium]
MTRKKSDEKLRDVERLLDAGDVADILHVSRSMVYRLIEEGNLSPIRIGHALRFRQKDVQAYIETRRRKK